MARKKRTATQESAVKRDLFESGLYGKRVQRDRTKYHRAAMKHPERESFAKLSQSVGFAKGSKAGLKRLPGYLTSTTGDTLPGPGRLAGR